MNENPLSKLAEEIAKLNEKQQETNTHLLNLCLKKDRQQEQDDKFRAVWEGRDRWKARLLFFALSLSVTSFLLNVVKLNTESAIVKAGIEILEIIKAAL